MSEPSTKLGSGSKKSPYKYNTVVDSNVVTINTAHCRFELETLQYIIEKYGYRETTLPGDGDLLWYGLALREHDIDTIRIRKNIYYNRYPGMEHLARKKILCAILNRYLRLFPEAYKFTPISFLLPEEQYDLDDYMKQFPQLCFIAKPSKGRGGEGIMLLKKFSDIPRWALN